MLYKNVESTDKPESVLMERLPDGSTSVRLRDNIRAEKREYGDGEIQDVYIYDEVMFNLGADRKEDKSDIEGDFSSWWVFGSEPEEPAPTIEEQVSLLMQIMTDFMGG